MILLNRVDLKQKNFGGNKPWFDKDCYKLKTCEKWRSAKSSMDLQDLIETNLEIVLKFSTWFSIQILNLNNDFCKK